MLISHRRAASNEAAVLQACHVSDVHATMQPHRHSVARSPEISVDLLSF